MKFSQYLKALDSDAPAEWQGKFINYKKLKKLLKSLG
jgi:SPX domain protein involved in polyphosphate accumulation